MTRSNSFAKTVNSRTRKGLDVWGRVETERPLATYPLKILSGYCDAEGLLAEGTGVEDFSVF